MVRSWVSRNKSSDKWDWHSSKPKSEESPQIYSQPHPQTQAFEANKQEADACTERKEAWYRNHDPLDLLLENINKTYSAKQANLETSPPAPQALQEQLSLTQQVAPTHLDESSVTQIDEKEVSREAPTYSAPQLQAKGFQSYANSLASNKQKLFYSRLESLSLLEPKQGVDETLLQAPNKQKLDFSLGKPEQPLPKQLPEATSVVSRFKERLNVPTQEEPAQTQKAKELSRNTKPLNFNKEPHQKLGLSRFEQAQAETKQAKLYTDIGSSKTNSDNQRQLLAIRIPSIEDAKKVKKQIQDFIELLNKVASKSNKLLKSVTSNPLGFAKNLAKALIQGLKQFSQPERLKTYVQNGLVGWLTGGMGVQQSIDFSNAQSLFNLAVGLLGLTWKNYIYPKLEKRYGKANMQRLEKSFALFIKLKNEGLSGIWEDIKNQVGKLKQLQELVVGEITNMLINVVIKKAVNKLLSSLFGSILTIIQTCYDLIVFLFEKAKNIAGVAASALGALENVADGNTKGAANLVENALAKSIPILIGFMASLVGITNLKEKVKSALAKIRQRIDKAFDKLLDKIEPQVQKLLTTVSSQKPQLVGAGGIATIPSSNSKPQIGNTRKPNQKPGNTRKPNNQPQTQHRTQRYVVRDFNVRQAFKMSGEGHHLIAEYKRKLLTLWMASNPLLLIPALEDAVKELETPNPAFSDEERKDCLGIIKKALAEAENVKYDVEKNLNAITGEYRTGNNQQAIQKAVEQETKSRLAIIANNLQKTGTLLGITALDKIEALKKYYKNPPKERYLPIPTGTTPSEFIRGFLYDKWDSVSKAFSQREKPKLIQKIKQVQAMPAGTQRNNTWNKLKRSGLVENKFTGKIEDYNPNSIIYEVDHIRPLAILWNFSKQWNNNIAGHDTDDAERNKHMSDPTNLQIVTREYNRSKSSGGITFFTYVGLNFTSRKAESGIKGALRFNGKPFKDAGGNPLI